MGKVHRPEFFVAVWKFVENSYDYVCGGEEQLHMYCRVRGADPGTGLRFNPHSMSTYVCRDPHAKQFSVKVGCSLNSTGDECSLKKRSNVIFAVALEANGQVYWKNHRARDRGQQRIL